MSIQPSRSRNYLLVSRLLPLHKLLKNEGSGLKSLSISLVPDCNLCCQISDDATLLISSSVLVVVGPSAAALPSTTLVVSPPPPRQPPPTHGIFRDLLLVYRCPSPSIPRPRHQTSSSPTRRSPSSVVGDSRRKAFFRPDRSIASRSIH